jgi:type IV secretory pathway VirB10-like protein
MTPAAEEHGGEAGAAGRSGPSEAAAAAPAAKLDPAALALRVRPRRAVRFRREVIVALAAATSLGVAAVAWFALQPASFRFAAAPEEAPKQAARTPEVLAGAPGSYDEVPKLGPRLPGDLGGPILKRRREQEVASGLDTLPAGDREAAAQRAAEARASEVAAARQSGVMMSIGAARRQAPQGEGGKAGDIGAADTPGAAFAGSGPGLAILAAEGDPQDVSPHRIRAAASPWILSSGSVIAASLVTGLDSDTPGLVVAQVSQNAYDSITGRTLLVPQGARLVGRYDRVLAFGQSRALVVWQRLVFPDGASIRIDNLPASDAAGYAGLADKVDYHSWSLLKGIGLSTLLGVGTELGFGDGESELVRAFREAAQQSGARAGDRIAEKNLDIPPTIRVRPGWPLRVVVHKDLVLKPWRS